MRDGVAFRWVWRHRHRHYHLRRRRRRRQVLFADRGSACPKFVARRKLQGRYLEQIYDLYDTFNIVEMPLMDNEVRDHGGRSLVTWKSCRGRACEPLQRPAGLRTVAPQPPQPPALTRSTTDRVASCVYVVGGGPCAHALACVIAGAYAIHDAGPRRQSLGQLLALPAEPLRSQRRRRVVSQLPLLPPPPMLLLVLLCCCCCRRCCRLPQQLLLLLLLLLLLPCTPSVAADQPFSYRAPSTD
jgi:hypothetical protein